MRKLIVFLVFMNFLLLGGGQYLNAGTHHSSHLHAYEHKHRVKYTNQDQGSSIIEEADLDEEHLGDDTFKNNVVNKNFAANYSLLDNWYLTFSSQIVVNYHSHFKFFVPFCGNSNPIYITQRVLRI